jgi:Domain of unknown function (DUF4410)
MRLFFCMHCRGPRLCWVAALSLLVAGCAKAAITPESIVPPDPLLAYNAIEAERTAPAQVYVLDFSFVPSAITENTSPLHRAIGLARSTQPLEREVAIGQRAAAALSGEVVKRLGKTGLRVVWVPDDQPLPARGDYLLVTGRLIDVDEGNRFERVALGFGLGESRLACDVHVFRVVDGEKAEVLALSTYADSGKMPGMAASTGLGLIAIGPITAITVVEEAAKDAASGGQKLYVSQVDYLASETGNQVSRYISQYAAAEHWIPRNRAKPAHLVG